MEGNFDSHLRIKVMALGSFPICLYREAMHLQCFPPTRNVRGVATRAHKRERPLPTLVKIDCLLALYGFTMHPAQLCGGFWAIFSA